MSQILKSSFIIGRTIQFRNVSVDDAEFIYKLRSNNKKNKYLSNIPKGIENQISWIKNYEKSIGQAYFIIEEKNLKNRIGTVRIYDAIHHPRPSFCWGSWILSSDAHSTAAIESALLVYEYGFGYLGFCESHFDVRVKNESVWKFHERMGAERVSETETDIYYKIILEKYNISKNKYNKYLPDGIKVVQQYMY